MEKQKKLSRKEKEAQIEQEYKQKYDERAYLQRTLDRKIKAQDCIKFAQKFMLVAFGIMSLIFISTLFIDFSWFWLVVSIISTSVFIGTIVWMVVYKVKYKAVSDQEIVEIREKLKNYYEKDMDKLKKIQQMLNGANNSSKDEN